MDGVPGRVSQRGLIIGVGNEFRSDDGVGPHVARRLAEKGLSGFDVVEQGGEATGLMEAWDGRETVMVIDAVLSGATPGTLFRFDAHSLEMPRNWFAGSTHSFGLEQAVELSRALGRLPARLVIFGVEGRTFAPGAGLSPDVQCAASVLVGRIEAEIRTGLPPGLEIRRDGGRGVTDPCSGKEPSHRCLSTSSQ